MCRDHDFPQCEICIPAKFAHPAGAKYSQNPEFTMSNAQKIAERLRNAYVTAPLPALRDGLEPAPMALGPTPCS
jgi:hypothetical protein